LNATPALPWHALPADDALSRLASSADGLTTEESRKRLARYGANELRRLPPTPAWRIFVAQFRSVIVLLLVAAATIAAGTGADADAIAIIAVLAINVALGFVVELRGRRAMEALRSLVVPGAQVVRDGTVRVVEAALLVPGDIIVLSAGARVPADARLVTATEGEAMEAALTGESLPVAKTATVILDERVALPDRVNMVFQGTTIIGGHARGVVVATGMLTELGRIQRLVSETGDERTPLERRLDTLGRRLAVVALGLAALLAVVDLRSGASLALLLETSIAVAVAAVPEGLPVVVTVAMAIGVRRMARRQALVRHLPSVETLGSTTVICTDKTGTLTAGEMAVTTVWSLEGEWTLPREEEPRANDPEAVPPPPQPSDPLVAALRVAALSCTIAGAPEGADSRIDPEEQAVLVATRRMGIDPLALEQQEPQAGIFPFSSARMLSATFRRRPDGTSTVFVKGAASRVIDLCDRVVTPDGDMPLDPAARRQLEEENERLAGNGLRVLALATGEVTSPDESGLQGLSFVGFVGLMDPPAPGVKQTVGRLRDAGIRIIMLTGDQLPTAAAVARELSLASDGGALIAGAELDRLSTEDLIGRVAHLAVASRVTPETKLRVVDALRRRGEIVAMLGDGVNDAPALRKADIGVALGRRGTDSAREAADLVLADDRFETVAAAVEEGRVIFENIRRFVFYLFSCNLGELLVLFAAGVAGLPLPLLPLQLLWLNLVTDTFPALALAFEPGEGDVMRRAPRDPRAEIMSRPLVWLTMSYAVLIGGTALAAFGWGRYARPDDARYASTLCFMTLALSQLFHLGNARGRGAVLSPPWATANPFALGALAIGIGLQVAAAGLPGLARLLGVVPLDVADWTLIVGLSAVPAAVGQVWKVMRGR
jgi:P-type Ca2+ transporter type 2C